MPVSQVIPQIQPDFSIANAIEQLGQIGSKAFQEYDDSKKRAGHNERMYAQAVDTLADIRKGTGMSDDQYGSLLKSITPEKDDPNYDAKVSNIVGSLYLWSEAKKNTGANIPIPDINIPFQQYIPLLESQIKGTTQRAEVESTLGPSPIPQAAQPKTVQQQPAPISLPSFQRDQNLFSDVVSGKGFEAPEPTYYQQAFNTVRKTGEVLAPPTPASSQLQPTIPASQQQPVSNAPLNAPQEKNNIERLIESMDPIYREHAMAHYQKAQKLRSNPSAAGKELSEIYDLEKQDAKLKESMAERGLIESAATNRNTADITSREKIASEGNTSAEKIARIGAEGRKDIAAQNAYSQRTVQLKPSQEDALINLDKNMIDLQGINNLMKNKYAGVVAGRAGAAKQFFGLLGKDEKTFRSALAGFKNELLKVRSGAAVTDQEMRRIANELPNLNESSEQFRAALNKSLIAFKNAKNNYITGLIKGGYDVKGWANDIEPIETYKGGAIPDATQGNVPRETSIKTVTSAADYAAIPSGSEYLDPQGNRRRKP